MNSDIMICKEYNCKDCNQDFGVRKSWREERFTASVLLLFHLLSLRVRPRRLTPFVYTLPAQVNTEAQETRHKSLFLNSPLLHPLHTNILWVSIFLCFYSSCSSSISFFLVYQSRAGILYITSFEELSWCRQVDIKKGKHRWIYTNKGFV